MLITAADIHAAMLPLRRLCCAYAPLRFFFFFAIAATSPITTRHCMLIYYASRHAAP